jgi:hypothetical protein
VRHCLLPTTFTLLRPCFALLVKTSLAQPFKNIYI